MKTRYTRLIPVIVTCAIGASAATYAVAADADSTGTSSNGASDTTSAVVAAADAFLASLSSTQKSAVSYAYSDTTDKYKWSNLPTGMTGRPGLKLGSLTAAQQALALAVVKAELSDQGYSQEEQIRLADDNLNANGGGSAYGSGLYYIAFYGTPSTSSAFSVQFGGHHMAINADFEGDSIAITPEFVGVEPQTFTSGTTTYTPMSGEKTAVFNLLGSLSSSQLSSALISGNFSDVVKGAGTDTTAYPSNSGVLVSSLSTAQQALVTEVIKQWVNDFPADVAQDYLAAYTSASAYAQTYVGYGNTSSSTGRAYLRISGPRVWIEYIHQNGVVYQNQLHIHSVFRDKSFDYNAGSGTTPTTTTPSATASRASSITASLRRKTVTKGRRAILRYKTGPASPAVSGTVRIKVDGRVVKTIHLAKTQAGTWQKVKLPRLGLGKHKIRIVFTPSAGFTGSKTPALTLRVKRR